MRNILPHLFTETYTSDTRAGMLTTEWAARLGLPQGIAVAVGALDAHMGAVGASVAPGVPVSYTHLDVYKRQEGGGYAVYLWDIAPQAFADSLGIAQGTSSDIMARCV